MRFFFASSLSYAQPVLASSVDKDEPLHRRVTSMRQRDSALSLLSVSRTHLGLLQLSPACFDFREKKVYFILCPLSGEKKVGLMKIQWTKCM
jgi:hypothetical protein